MDIFDTLTLESPKKKKDLFDEIGDQEVSQPQEDIFDQVERNKPIERIDNTPSLASKAIDALQFNPITKAVSDTVKNIRGIRQADEGMYQDIIGVPKTLLTAANPFLASEIASKKEIPPEVMDLGAAAAYEAAGGVKGATLGYVDPTPLLEKTPLAEANINKNVAGMAGQFVGALAPISLISKGAGMAMQGAKFLEGVNPVLQRALHTAVTGAVFGGAYKPEVEGMSERAKNALNASAGFIALGAIGELAPVIKEFITTKKANVPFSAQDVRDFYIFGKEKLSPETYDILQRIPKEDLVRMAKAGEGGVGTVRVPRFGKQPISGVEEPTQAAKPTTTDLTKVTPGEKPPEPATPLTTVSEETIGKQASNYINSRFPNLAKNLEGKSLPLTQEELHSSLKRAATMGEEALLRGATPQEAEIASMKAFTETSKPLIEKNVPRGMPGVNQPPVVTPPVAQLEHGKTAPLTNLSDVSKALGIEPHQMTKNEYLSVFGGGRPEPEVIAEHQNLIDQAYNAGKPVPPRVLNEYPGIQAKASQQKAWTELDRLAKTNKVDDQFITALVDHIDIQEKALKAEYGPMAKKEDYEAVGGFFPRGTKDTLNDLIELSLKATPETARHEFAHFANLRLLNDGQRNILAKKYANENEMADAYAEFKSGKSTGDGIIDRIFQAIKDFFERLKNYFKHKNFQTANDIFKAMDEGKLKRPEPAGGGLERYQAGYHGSPYDFERFDMSKVGTGEGAQAYGHGLYFSSKEDVAKFYRKELGTRIDAYDKNGKIISESKDPYRQRVLNSLAVSYQINGSQADIFDIVKDGFKRELTGGMRQDIAKELGVKPTTKQIETVNRYLSELNKLKDEGVKFKKHIQGRIYKVDIPEDSDMLDWDKIIADQLKPIQTIAKELKLDPYQTTGEQLYSQLSEDLGGDKQASQFLSSKGIPGLKYLDQFSRAEGKGTSNYVIFDEKAVKILEKYSAQKKEPAPMFYSQLQKVLGQKMPNRAMPDQIKGIIQGNVKQEESDWVGLNEWLAEKKGSVTKQEVMDFLKQNEVQVQEVMKGDEPPTESSRSTKFEKYTLPGGENYRELLLTLPANKSTLRVESISKAEDGFQVNLSDGTRQIFPRARTIQEARDAAMAHIDEGLWGPDTNFRSSHFSEPNILAHVRFNDRVDAEGKKVLFIEEIQSDWGQAGRKFGFKGTDSEQIKTLELERDKLAEQAVDFEDKKNRIEYERAMNRITEINEQIKKLGKNDAQVPRMPFAKSWSELALKRILRYATENGYDKIAWTTGEQQAERYDLSKQVDKITYTPSSDKSGALHAYKNGEKVISERGIAPDQLSNYVGKEGAKKLLEQPLTREPKPGGGEFYPAHILEGKDLKIGGEGMKGFYDQMIPSFLNKYTKKWGGRVGETEIETGSESLSENDFESKEYLDENMVKGGLTDEWYLRDPEKYNVEYVDLQEFTNKDGTKDYEANFSGNAEFVGKTFGEAIKKISKGVGAGVTGGKVHSLDITPSMKESVLYEGQPMYKAEKLPRREMIQREVNKLRFPSRRMEPKAYTERMALRRSLQRQATAAIESKRATIEELNNRKKEIADTIKEYLPLQERGQFLITIANAATHKDLVKAINRLDQAVDKFQKKILMNSLKTEVKRINKFQTIAVDYKFKVNMLMSDILMQKPRADTLRRYTDLKNYVTEQVKLGRDVTVPQYILDNLRVLTSKPLADMKTVEIEDILGKVRTLADLGKTKLKVRKELDGLNKDKDLADLAQGTKPLENLHRTVPDPGERLTVMENLQNKLKNMANAYEENGDSFMPTDPLFDYLDGGQDYAGPNYRIFKRRPDLDFTNYLQDRKKFNDALKPLIMGMDEKNSDRIGIYAHLQQEGGLEKLYNRYGIKLQPITHEELMAKEAIDKKLAAIKLTPQEMAVYNHMRREMDKTLPQITEVMKEVYNADVGQVQNYFPFMTDFEIEPDIGIDERIKIDFAVRKKNVEAGFTKERVGTGSQTTRIDAFGTYLRHMDDVAYLLNMGKTIKYLGELARSDNYRNIMGDLGQRIVLDYVDTLARKGGSMGGQQIKWLDKARVNMGVATLGFKLSSMLIQFGPIGEGAGWIGNYAFTGTKDFIFSPQWRKFVFDNMPEVRDRVGDDPALSEYIKTGAITKKLADMSYWGLKTFDGFSANSIAIGAYQKWMKEHGLPIDFNNPNPEAIWYSQFIVRRSQGSSFFKDVPQTISRGKFLGSENKSLARAVWQFQNFVLNQWSVMRHDIWREGVAKGEFKQPGSLAAWLVLTAFATTGMRLGIKGIKDWMTGYQNPKKKSLQDQFIQGTIQELVGRVPFVSQAMSLMMYESMPVPALDFIFRGAQGATRLFGKTPTTRMRGAVGVVGSAGRFLGVPGTAEAESVMRGMIPQKKKGLSIRGPRLSLSRR